MSECQKYHIGQEIDLGGKTWVVSKIEDHIVWIEPMGVAKTMNYMFILYSIVCLFVLAVIIFSSSAKADCDEIYLKVGTGYKFSEQDTVILGDKEYNVDRSPYSARFETGVECRKLTFGLSHHSQWDTGAPFNETGEYYKTELFIDYKFSWGI